MLRIQRLKWKGRCKKHPSYNPATDGLGAVRGGCITCQKLFEIWEYNSKTVRLMREVSPPIERRRAVPDDPQLSLLED